MASKEVEPYVYTVMLHHAPAVRFSSTVDLCKQWEDAIADRSKKGDWWRPIRFSDEDGETVLVVAANMVIGVLRGLMPGSITG